MTTAVSERACEHCGVLFTPKRATGRFHADACRAAHRRGQRVSVPNANSSAEGSLSGLATVTAIRSAGSLTWDPAPASFGRPFRSHDPADICPACGAALWAEPCGTWLACLACKRPVAPAAIAAAYDRVSGGVQRSAATEADRDRADVILFARKDQLLRQVAASGLPAGSEVAAGLAAKIRAAASEHRLAQLAGLLGELLPVTGPAAGHAEIVAGEIADDDGQDQAAAVATAARPVPSLTRFGVPHALPAPGPPRPLTTAAGALTALGLGLSAGSSGGCQVTEDGRRCGAETRFSVAGDAGLAWICGRHNQLLCRAIRAAERQLA